jgi:predicted amidohydrolase YtcJ
MSLVTDADLTIRRVEIEGRAGLDVQIRNGRIAAIGPGLAAYGPELDGRGGALIPGLIDHHIHLLAAAAQAQSVVLDDVPDAGAFAQRLRAAAAARPPGAWVRATGYHEAIAGMIDRDSLDAVTTRNPLRVQDRTGALWVLNSPGLVLVAAGETPDCVERDAADRPTGRIWRGDAWLQTRIGASPPPLAPLGAVLVATGVTGVTDASATTTAAEAGLLAEAVRAGDLPLRLVLMSAGPLTSPNDAAFSVGPMKILLDERDLPPLDDLIERIGQARSWARAVAVHCVTDGELALTLAAFHAAGSQPGDRVEHGGLVPSAAIPVVKSLGLAVVTQPGFVFERGDRYLAEVPEAEQADLYRCASLIGAGVPVAASSDAPYSSPDPWGAMRAAVSRRTRSGRPLGERERVTPARALQLFLGGFDHPGGPPRRVEVGAPADLCVLKTPLAEALDALSADLVAATLVRGAVRFESG